MDLDTAMTTLEAAGTAQNRKVYRRHGVSDPLFGVSYAEQRKLAKKIKTDHNLARELWTTGNHDARILATLIADPEAADEGLEDAWAADLDNYVLADAFTAYLASSPRAQPVFERWRDDGDEWKGQTAWGLLSHLAMKDDTFTDDELRGFLEVIEQEIHGRANRVRHSMNAALIAIGLRNEALRDAALTAARRIGPVEVDHGETGCKTPAAEPYIEKGWARKRKKAG